MSISETRNISSLKQFLFRDPSPVTRREAFKVWSRSPLAHQLTLQPEQEWEGVVTPLEPLTFNQEYFNVGSTHHEDDIFTRRIDSKQLKFSTCSIKPGLTVLNVYHPLWIKQWNKTVYNISLICCCQLQPGSKPSHFIIGKSSTN